MLPFRRTHHHAPPPASASGTAAGALEQEQQAAAQVPAPAAEQAPAPAADQSPKQSTAGRLTHRVSRTARAALPRFPYSGHTGGDVVAHRGRPSAEELDLHGRKPSGPLPVSTGLLAGGRAQASGGGGGGGEGPLPASAHVVCEGITPDGALQLDLQFSDSLEEAAAGGVPAEQARQPGTERAGSGAPLAPVREGGVAAPSPGADRAAAQPPADAESAPESPKLKEAVAAAVPCAPAPAAVRPLRIVMLVAGTRGDVQPFVALGLKLQEHGHRVRLASHAVYREFVTSFGLEFYPLGGDPKVLSDYIVRNRGIMPGSVRSAVDNYRQVAGILRSTWPACTEPDPQGGAPFTAQAIIANPPVYGHIHCAEKLGVPLHMFFTMPWTPTKAFPHPLARLKPAPDGRRTGLRNQLSYLAVDEFTGNGLAPAIASFRTQVLHLPALRLGNSGSHLLQVHKVPFSYCWSPVFVPKPDDWGDHISVVGYFFLHQGAKSGYQPPPELEAFLAAGPRPVYVGFGSLMVDDPAGLTATVLEAAQRTGSRVLLSRGWGKLGDGCQLPPSVLPIDDVPHDWLLPRCAAAVHHGGAGTTAASLVACCPTTVIPFFGDQPFWGDACARAGVGPCPIPVDELTPDKLTAAFEFMARPEARAAAERVAAAINKEDGVAAGVAAFHAALPAAALVGGRVDWDLTPPALSNFLGEVGGGAAGLLTEPISGALHGGGKGAVVGMGRGIAGAVIRPLHGLQLSAQDLATHGLAAGKGCKAQVQELCAELRSRTSQGHLVITRQRDAEGGEDDEAWERYAGSGGAAPAAADDSAAQPADTRAKHLHFRLSSCMRA